jgi:hypothetical protein
MPLTDHYIRHSELEIIFCPQRHLWEIQAPVLLRYAIGDSGKRIRELLDVQARTKARCHGCSEARPVTRVIGFLMFGAAHTDADLVGSDDIADLLAQCGIIGSQKPIHQNSF